MLELDDDELRTWFGFGVAGNFAGHLEQAGEAADFVNVTSEGTAPEGHLPLVRTGLRQLPRRVPAVARRDQAAARVTPR